MEQNGTDGTKWNTVANKRQMQRIVDVLFQYVFNCLYPLDITEGLVTCTLPQTLPHLVVFTK